MTDNAQIVLLEYLAKRYTRLKHNLARLLGNDDLASDALHDAWVRLHAKEDYGTVDNPAAYVTRMSVNIAVNAHNRQSRQLSGEEAEALLGSMADSAPGPERVAAARSELAALARILETMPQRRQLVAALLYGEGMGLRTVAEQLQISERTVVREIKHIQAAIAQARGR